MLATSWRGKNSLNLTPHLNVVQQIHGSPSPVHQVLDCLGSIPWVAEPSTLSSSL